MRGREPVYGCAGLVNDRDRDVQRRPGHTTHGPDRAQRFWVGRPHRQPPLDRQHSLLFWLMRPCPLSSCGDCHVERDGRPRFHVRRLDRRALPGHIFSVYVRGHQRYGRVSHVRPPGLHVRDVDQRGAGQAGRIGWSGRPVYESCDRGRPAGNLPGLAVEQHGGRQLQSRQRRLGARRRSALRAQYREVGRAWEPGGVLPAADRRVGQRHWAGPCHGRHRRQPGRDDLWRSMCRLRIHQRRSLRGRRHRGQRLLGLQPAQSERLFVGFPAVLLPHRSDGRHQASAAAGAPRVRDRGRMVAVWQHHERGRLLSGRRDRGRPSQRQHVRGPARHQHGMGGLPPDHRRHSLEAGGRRLRLQQPERFWREQAAGTLRPGSGRQPVQQLRLLVRGQRPRHGQLG